MESTYHLMTIQDLSEHNILDILNEAERMESFIQEKKVLNICNGYEMASLFFEPSTRTRLSFETAMHRLGGNVTSVVDKYSTSLAKGETIADTARIIGSYVDIIVLRHPLQGAARAMSHYAGVPVINAGDGAHEHPTQTLCDLYTLKKKKKTLENLTIALCGDLKYGRTVHSLAFALARLKANLVLIPAPGLEMPEYVIRRLVEEFFCHIEKYEGEKDIKEAIKRIDVLYRSKKIDTYQPKQLRILELREVIISPNFLDYIFKPKGGGSIPPFDAFYITRMQQERNEQENNLSTYPVIDKKLLKKARLDTLIMHPLPRVDELSSEIDDDERSVYFEQAAYGVPVRMALITFMLGLENFVDRQAIPYENINKLIRYKSGFRCPNTMCISSKEQLPTAGNIPAEFYIAQYRKLGLYLRCAYCDYESKPKYIGDNRSKKSFPFSSESFSSIPAKDMIFFDDVKEVRDCGFKTNRTIGS